MLGAGREALQFIGAQHIAKCFQQRWQRQGQLHIVKQPADILERIGNALQKVRLALVKSAETIRAERLHDADVNVSVVIPHQGFAVERDKFGDSFEIVIEQLLTQFRRKVGFGVE